MSLESNKALISEFISQVLNQKRLDEIGNYIPEDFTELDPLPGQQQGRDGLKQTLAGLFTAFPDMFWTIQEQIAEGNMVVTRFTWTGTQQGNFLGIPPTGNKVAVKGVVIDKIAAGKVSESRILMDSLGLMQQLGVIPMP